MVKRKYRLLILIFLITAGIQAQVPDNNSFTLQDVVDEVNPSSNDLQQCFNDAVASEFDPEYEEDKNELDDFRNYGGATEEETYFAGISYDATLADNSDYQNVVTNTTDNTFSIDVKLYKDGSQIDGGVTVDIVVDNITQKTISVFLNLAPNWTTISDNFPNGIDDYGSTWSLYFY